MIDQLCDVVQIKIKRIKAQQEPQSEAEESKEEANFSQSIFKEADKFMEALRNNAIVNEADIENLKSSRVNQ